MVTRWSCYGLLAVGMICRAGVATADHFADPILLGDDDRLLVLAPHPSDETLATGGLIQEALGLGLPVKVCFFTMGDNHEMAALFTRQHPALIPGAMRATGQQRHREAIAAALQLGLTTNDLVFLGYPDSGTLDIWTDHWRTVPPYRSPLTRATAVPYRQALTPGSAYAGEDILDDLEEVIRDFRPTHLAVSHPADHNADHRALYLFTQVALWNVAAEGIAPHVLAYPVHFTQWPQPRGLDLHQRNIPPYYLGAQTQWAEFALAPFQVTNKLAAIRRHHSQYQQAAICLQPLLRRNEWFGDWVPIAWPAGEGDVEILEEDATHFHVDPHLFQTLSQTADSWSAVMDQHEVEEETLGGHRNGIIQRMAAGDGEHIVLSLQFLNPLTPPAQITLYLYGYRADTDFGDMPKIQVVAQPPQKAVIRDLQQKLSASAMELTYPEPDQIALRVSYETLGFPQAIFTGAQLAHGSLPLDWLAWRTIDLRPAAADIPAAEEAEWPVPATAVPAPPVSPAPGGVSPPAPQLRLTPKIHLSRKPSRPQTEADEPVFW